MVFPSIWQYIIDIGEKHTVTCNTFIFNLFERVFDFRKYVIFVKMPMNVSKENLDQSRDRNS